MPSFLQKVFGRKKEDGSDSSKPLSSRRSNPSLLEGKFEAIVPPPIVTTDEQPSPKEPGFGLFRPKSRSAKSPASPVPRIEDLPSLSLNLPGQRDENGSRALGVVFEGDRDVVLEDSVIGSKRLSPTETIALVKACSQVITERGLETLGIMHPHWHSASPEIQRRLISLFIQSLSTQKPASTPFEAELKFTRSPHDVAAVLRWGLRHLQLDGTSFGKGPTEWAWYQSFSTEERVAEYPPKAFTQKLVPLLPQSHLDLLMATLEIESSLAAHAEHNSISGSKMSKFLGLWLLTASRAEENDNWESFYARWERAGRILEHIFLARIRDESVNHRMPMRLTELVNQYPYGRSSISSEEDDLLPRPRFSTRSYDALFVRIDTELATAEVEKPKGNRLRLIAHAFKLDAPPEGGPIVGAWNMVKKAAVETNTEDDKVDADNFALNRVFNDETIRLLSLIPTDGSEPAVNLISPSIARSATTRSRRRSSSLGGVAASKGPSSPHNVNFQAKAAHIPLPASPTVDIDWADFSSVGFGEPSTVGPKLSSTLLDSDIETTKPTSSSLTRRISKGRRNITRNTSRRSSLDNPNPTTPITPPLTDAEILAVSRASLVSVIQVDEAFIDFWSDAALDPVSASWPTFVICKLNPIPGVQVTEGKPISWLVIEQTHSIKHTPVPPSPVDSDSRVSLTGTPRLSTSRADLSRMSSTLSATRKRFSFFGGSTVSKPEKTKSRRSTSDKKSTKIGEMGEIMQEEDEQPKTAAAGVTATDVAAGAAATIVGAAAAVVGAVAVVIGSPQHEHRDPIQDTVTVPVGSVAGEHTATADAAVPEPDAAGTQTAIDTATTAGADAHELTSAVVPAAVLEQSADAAVPELTHTMIAKDVDVLEPAVAEEQSQVDDTSVAKGADVDFAVAVSPAAAIEPLQKQEAVDTATAKDIDSSELTAAAPAAEVEEHAEPSTKQDAADTFQKFTSEREEVSVAPETVLASGETPGPQQILDASEPVPAEVHQVQESFVHDVNAPGPETAMDTEPATIEPLRDQEEANQAAATPEEHSHDAPEAEPVVELPAVPIVSTSVEDVAPAAEVDTTEPAPATEAEPTHETPVDTDE